MHEAQLLELRCVQSFGEVLESALVGVQHLVLGLQVQGVDARSKPHEALLLGLAREGDQVAGNKVLELQLGADARLFRPGKELAGVGLRCVSAFLKQVCVPNHCIGPLHLPFILKDAALDSLLKLSLGPCKVTLPLAN